MHKLKNIWRNLQLNILLVMLSICFFTLILWIATQSLEVKGSIICFLAVIGTISILPINKIIEKKAILKDKIREERLPTYEKIQDWILETVDKKNYHKKTIKLPDYLELRKEILKYGSDYLINDWLRLEESFNNKNQNNIKKYLRKIFLQSKLDLNYKIEELRSLDFVEIFNQEKKK